MKSVSVLLFLAVIILHSTFKTEAVEFSAPFLVSIQQREKGEIEHICIGTILSAGRVLTSEKCLETGIEDLYVAAGVLDQSFKGKESKIISYNVPETSNETKVFQRLAVATIDPPLQLDGKEIAKINVDSERIDTFPELLNGTFRVFLYYYSTEGIVKRLDMIPKRYRTDVKVLNKELYLVYNNRYGDTGCDATEGTSVGSPVVRDNELVGVVMSKLEKDGCDVETDAVAIRTPIFVYWIEDQLREEEFARKRELGCDKSANFEVNAPFLVSIQRYTPTGTLKHFCTGALIAPDLILTAAICLKKGIKKLVAVVGITSLTDPVGQRRAILSYEISDTSEPPDQEVAVARVYPKYSTDDGDASTIAVKRDMMCNELSFLQYLYGSDMIYISNYTREIKSISPMNAFSIVAVEDVVFGDCPFKLGSYMGAPIAMDDQVIGVIISDVDNDYCHIHTKKVAVPVVKFKRWISSEMKEKTVVYDEEAKPS